MVILVIFAIRNITNKIPSMPIPTLSCDYLNKPPQIKGKFHPIQENHPFHKAPFLKGGYVTLLPPVNPFIIPNKKAGVKTVSEQC
jgi:hypothetical protein